MEDSWLDRNTDKILLFTLVIMGGGFMLHIIHHGNPDAQLITWLENAFSTVLGALILILTGRLKSNGGNGNGTPPQVVTSTPTPGSHL